LNKATKCDIIFRMTASELELKTRRFTAKMSDKELDKLIGIIEDIRDARSIERSLAGGFKTTPWEEIRDELDQRFGIKSA
jgi:hypothetical protein